MQIRADIENHSTYRQQIEIFPTFFETQQQWQFATSSTVNLPQVDGQVVAI